MKRLLVPLVAVCAIASAGHAFAEPEYVTIEMEIAVNKPAAEVWTKVGKFCDLSTWLDIDCAITSGDGGIGTVRAVAGGRVTEVLVGLTELSYGYVMPPRDGQFYNLYHGYLESRPVTPTTSKLLYTLVYDISDQPDQAAKDADIARRRMTFEGALQNMKKIAEAD